MSQKQVTDRMITYLFILFTGTAVHVWEISILSPQFARRGSEKNIGATPGFYITRVDGTKDGFQLISV
jgi:hypothetical protein